MTGTVDVTAPAPVQRVSTLELFFDLVFVFTVTQLTAVLSHDLSWEALRQVMVMLALATVPLGSEVAAVAQLAALVVLLAAALGGEGTPLRARRTTDRPAERA